MDREKVRNKLEDIILNLEIAQGIDEKYKIHEEMSKQGKSLIVGSRKDFKEELEALKEAYSQSLSLLSSLE